MLSRLGAAQATLIDHSLCVRLLTVKPLKVQEIAESKSTVRIHASPHRH
jgi:hypothetical protein